MYFYLLKLIWDLKKSNYVWKGDFDLPESCFVNGTFPQWFLDHFETQKIKVEKHVNLYNKGLKELPPIFSSVGGNFWCNNNQLTSLSGSPGSVGGDFWCSHNQLTSLRGAPDSVGGYFYCYNNPGNFTEEDVGKVCIIV